MKLAAIGDIHVKETDAGKWKVLFSQIEEEADVLILCGDLTDSGLVQQAKILVHETGGMRIPIVAVLGNHDYAQGQNQEIYDLLKSKNISILQGESTIIEDVGFAGTKGFCGGFDNHLLTAFGEQEIKHFVEVAVQESLALENALNQLNQLDIEKKVVVLHYSPISQTVVGEPPEIFPFLGSSRFVSPIHRFHPQVVFHGHAHHGTIEGKTEQGIPVFNVSYALLHKRNPKKPYLIFEV